MFPRCVFALLAALLVHAGVALGAGRSLLEEQAGRIELDGLRSKAWGG